LKKQELIYEGKAKRLYATTDPELLIQEFKDDATAFDGKKKAQIKGKGAINNQISAFLFQYLESYNVSTHFVKTLSETEMLIRKLEMIPVEVVMRNIAAGSLCERYGLEEGKELGYPILEYYLKNDELHDPMINEYHACAFGYATPDEMRFIGRLASKINAVLKAFFIRRDLKLVDLKLEFGRYKGKVILGDEISPDTCRLWDAKTGEKLDKDRFRHDLGGVEEAYQEIRQRVFS